MKPFNNSCMFWETFLHPEEINVNDLSVYFNYFHLQFSIFLKHFCPSYSFWDD